MTIRMTRWYATAGGFDTFVQAEAALYTHRPQAKKDPIAAQDLAYRQAAEYWSGRRASCDLSGTERDLLQSVRLHFRQGDAHDRELCHTGGGGETALRGPPHGPKGSRRRRNRPPCPSRPERNTAPVSGGGLSPPGKRHGRETGVRDAGGSGIRRLPGAIWKARWNRTALPTRVRLSTTCWRRSGSCVIGDFPAPEPPAAKEEQPPPPREDTETAAADRDLIGKEVTLEGRRFLVEKIDEDGRASLRDLTFEGTVASPSSV